MPRRERNAPLHGIADMNDSKNLAASVQARLLNIAKAGGRDYGQVLTKFALERLLYRLSQSTHADSFLLKGALLFDLWFDVPLRPTRDIDLLGFGLAELPHVIGVFDDLCSITVNDGIVFVAESIKAEEIRKEANYAGIRISMIGLLGTARASIQVDIGYGDAVTPAPETAIYPVLLKDFPAPELRVYPRYTVVAEKLETLTTLGIANTRMKDYFDLWVLHEQGEFDQEILRSAIAATFDRRGRSIPTRLPLGLSDEFANDAQKQRQWQAFLKKNQLKPNELDEVTQTLRAWLWPLMSA
jgi:predicted nucleotidyltransferase component of viral defense system